MMVSELRALVRAELLREARHMREVELPNGNTTQWSSDEYVAELQRCIRDISFWRDRSPRNTARRTDYTRAVQRLKSDLSSAMKARARRSEEN